MSEQLDICQAFLKYAPPGEFEQCYAAVSSIIDNSSVVQEARRSTIQEWTENECQIVKLDNDQSALMCSEGRQPDGSYLDPSTSKLYRYDFDVRQGTVIGPGPEGSPLRQTLQKKIAEYMTNSYKENAACGVFDGPNNTITIVLRSASVSLRNFRTGRVIGRYVYSSGNIKGRIEAYFHFFENGNAVCQHGGDLDKNCSESADDIVKKITAFETSWLTKFNEGLKVMGDEAILKLRRLTTVAKNKINWQQECTYGGGMQTH